MEEQPYNCENLWYGQATLTPDTPIIAGQMGSWQLVYRVGKYGVDNGGRIKVAFRLASDWSPPQFSDPTAADYFTARTTGRGSVTPTFEQKGYYRPWFRTVTLTVGEYPLAPGDLLIMTFGDTSGGGSGTRAQTFRESGFEFRVLVESFETGVFVRVPSSPRIPIVGDQAARLIAIAPSEAKKGEPFALTVKAEDRWGNPSPSYAGTVRFAFAGTGLPDGYTFSPADTGVRRFEGITLDDGDVQNIEVFDDAAGMYATSNPIKAISGDGDKGGRRYWADLHGQTETTVGTGTVAEYFAFARDVAAVDVSAHQGNDFQVTADDWREIQRETRRYHEPGRFITFLGYEWSGNTPAGGDHNVLWFEDDQPIYRSSHWQVADKAEAPTDRYPVSELYDTLRDEKALIIPHIGGRRAILDYHRDDQAPLIEICSVHGHFEWFLHEAFERDLKVGVVGNGDDHTGRPGASYATDSSFGVRGGLTCVLAGELTRRGIWEALQARRTYATTGERIYLAFSANGHAMGEECRIEGSPRFEVEVIGTGPLRSVEIVNGTQIAYAHPLGGVDDPDPNRIRITWRGARNTSRGRHTVWDGNLRIAGGEFLSAETFAFDNPSQGLVHRGADELQWKSSTSGDVDGLILSIRDEGRTELTFETGPCSFRVGLDQLRRERVIAWDAGGVEQSVEIALMPPRPGPKRVQFSFEDPNPRPGLNPYYLRLIQEDGEKAWSSPIYVNAE